MTIKTQKKFRFIPFLNFAIVATQWLSMYLHNAVPKKGRRIYTNLLIVSLLIFPVTIVAAIVDSTIKNEIISITTDLLVLYLDMYVPCLVLIHDQEKYYKTKDMDK